MKRVPILAFCTAWYSLLASVPGTETDDSGNDMFLTSGWSVKSDLLDNIVTSLRNEMDSNKATRGPWDQYLDEGEARADFRHILNKEVVSVLKTFRKREMHP